MIRFDALSDRYYLTGDDPISDSFQQYLVHMNKFYDYTSLESNSGEYTMERYTFQIKANICLDWVRLYTRKYICPRLIGYIAIQKGLPGGSPCWIAREIGSYI